MSGAAHGGGLEGPLVNEHVRWLAEGLVTVPDAGNPALGNHSGPDGQGTVSFHSLWAWRYCLPGAPSPLPPGCIPGPVSALPFLGLLTASVLVPLPTQGGS